MKKKLLCVIIAVIMIMQSTSFVLAAGGNEINVEVEMSARVSGTSDYSKGTLNITGRNTSIDINAVLNVSAVFNKFVELYESAQKSISGIVATSGGKLTQAGLTEQLNDIPIDSEFTVKMYIPKNVILSSDYTVDLRDMYGFDTDAQKVFYEKSRAYDESGDTYNLLTIVLGTGKDESTPLTIGELYKNRKTYLKDVAFTAYNVYLNGEGSYSFKGGLVGSTSVDGTVNDRSVNETISYTGVYNGNSENIGVDANLSYSKYSISGDVKNEDGTAVTEATVMLKQGDYTLLSTTTDETGHYYFENVLVGIYNIVVEYSGTTHTALADIVDHNVDHIDFTFVPKASSVLAFDKTTSDNSATIATPADILVDNIDAEAEALVAADETNALEKVEVMVTLAEKEDVTEEEVLPDTDKETSKTAQESIKTEIAVAQPEDNVIVDKFIDIKVEKTETPSGGSAGEPTQITETNKVLHFAIPYNVLYKDVKVYRYHEGVSEALDKINAMPADSSNYEDGKFFIDKEKNYIHIFANKFSMYAITYIDDTPEVTPPKTETDTDTPVYTGGVAVAKRYTVTFSVDGDLSVVDSIKTATLKYEDLPIPVKQGYSFDGWYLDGEMKNKVEQDISLKEDITLYGHFINQTLECENHFAYILGYPDGTIQPENYITREEVATIFYRLLKEEKRAEIESDINYFTDVKSDRWSNKYISTLAKGGYIEGYNDATFKPEAYITRAEFTAMATRFAYLTNLADNTFTDISDHWAIDYILKACNEGWIMGYEDNTFRPEDNISRAETMAIINRMLVRHVNAEGIHKDAKVWADNMVQDWYYYIVEEATNSHTYQRQTDGINETWIEIVK